MLTVLSTAPAIDASAIVRGKMVDLTWQEIRAAGWLVITFMKTNGGDESENVLAAWEDAIDSLTSCGIGVLVVSDQSGDELEARVRTSCPDTFTFPIIPDHDGRIARQYDMMGHMNERMGGTCVVDPQGVIRRVEASSLPLPSKIDEIVTSIEAATTPS